MPLRQLLFRRPDAALRRQPRHHCRGTGGGGRFQHLRGPPGYSRRNPPQGQFIDEFDGVRLHYLEQGEGPPVVLLHDVVTAEDFAYSDLLDLAAKNGSASSRSTGRE